MAQPPPPDRTSEPGSDPALDPAVEGQMLTLKGRFGDRLSDAEWDKVRVAITEQRQAAAAVRAVPLRNGDEPATTFVPFGPAPGNG